MEMIPETRRTFGRMNLMSLIRGTITSIESYMEDPRWKYTDYTQGHLVVIVVVMGITYLIQLIALIVTSILFNTDSIPYREVIAIIQPYFQSIQKIIFICLVPVQFFAFYNDPIRILEIISKDLHYSNITMTVLSSSIYISDFMNDDFSETFRLISLSISLIIESFIYYKLYSKIHLNENKTLKELLGFNILYSLALVVTLFDLARSIIIVASFDIDFDTTASDRALIVISLYFAWTILALYKLNDIFIGIGACYKLLGVFTVHAANICTEFYEDCNEAVLSLSMLYALFIACYTFLIYRMYPKAFKYEFSERRRRRWRR
jgi:hypothetical protein